MTFAELWAGLEPIGRDPQTGGYRRYSWTPADTACRAWFTGQAERRGLAVETDNNGNLWAWWGPKTADAVVTGSHLDSVPDGGAFDGPLGVVSALAAVDLLKDKSFSPERSVVLAAFTEEEGARFGVPCLGSRLLTGVVDPDAARALTDDAGTTLADAMIAAGQDPGYLGPRDDLLAGLGAFVELHVEQGRALAPQGAALGLAEGIWPHGRWRFEFTGRADHAGTARLADRHDPMLPYAATALAARQAAEQNGGRSHVRQGPRRTERHQRGALRGPGLAGRPRRVRSSGRGHGHHDPFGRRWFLRAARGRAQRAPGVVHPGRLF